MRPAAKLGSAVVQSAFAMDELQRKVDKHERCFKHLGVKLHGMKKERDDMKKERDDMKKERDELQEKATRLEKERDEAQGTAVALKMRLDALQATVRGGEEEERQGSGI